MPLSSEQTRARAQRAARKRWHGDGPSADAAREALDDATEQARVRAHIDAVIAAGVEALQQASPDQVEKLRALFAPLPGLDHD